MNLNEQLQNAKDRDFLHRMIDAMPEDGAIIVIANRCCYPECDGIGDKEHDSAHQLSWQCAGSILVYEAAGLLEMAKVDMLTGDERDEE